MLALNSCALHVAVYPIIVIVLSYTVWCRTTRSILESFQLIAYIPVICGYNSHLPIP